MGVGVNTSFGLDEKAKGTTVNVSASRSNSNTDETIHHNGSFSNVDEVHNNTGTMIIRGFNQEGGKVTGNIGRFEATSLQNTSTMTGSISTYRFADAIMDEDSEETGCYFGKV